MLQGLGWEVVLPEGETILGRSRSADVVVADPTVSRRHARIVVRGTTALVEDLGSANGTHLGGRPLARQAELRAGDHLRLGMAPVLIVAVARASSPRTRTDEAH